MSAREQASWHRLGRWLLRAIASVGFLGYVPVAPGTAGTLGAIPLALALHRTPLTWRLVIITALIFLAVAVSRRAEQLFGERDSQRIVIDEVVGFLIASLTIPFQPAFWFGAFIAFRIFDTVKPYPARRLARVPGGWGVVLDDVVAGSYTLIGLFIFSTLVRL